jgi:dihydrofolate reductase
MCGNLGGSTLVASIAGVPARGGEMGRIVTGASVSLDGYIAGPKETGFEHLFAWYGAGDVEFPSTHSDVRFSLTPADHAYLKGYVEGVGVLMVGRRLFNLVEGWGGVHPLDRPVVVVTHQVPRDWVAAHPNAPFTFATEGLANAIEQAREMAGDRNVGVTAGRLATQCLELGLLDEIWFDLVPVVLGSGVRFFDHVDLEPVLLEDPSIIEGARVTHLRYTVRRP